MLQDLREQGCPWDDTSCVRATAKGHLEVLQWAEGQGCP